MERRKRGSPREMSNEGLITANAAKMLLRLKHSIEKECAKEGSDSQEILWGVGDGQDTLWDIGDEGETQGFKIKI